MTTEGPRPRVPRVAMMDTRLRARIVGLRRDLDLHETEASRVRARLHVLVRTAVENGEPVTAVAAASGYHRQRVFQLTKGVD